MAVTVDSLALEVSSSAEGAVKGIDALAASLGRLKSAVKGGVGLNAVANQMTKLNTALSGVDSGSGDRVEKLASSLQKLAGLGQLKISSSVANQLTKIGSAAASLDGVDWGGVERLNTALEPLGGIEKASGLQSTITQLNRLPKVAEALNSVDWAGFTSNIQTLTNSLTPLASELNTVGAGVGKLPSNIGKVAAATAALAKTNDSARTSYVNLWAKAHMVANGLQKATASVATWINASNEYVESLNLFTASLGEYAAEAENYAEKVSEVMGIDPAAWMENQGVFNTIIEGFGVASDKAYLMSQNLTQLGYDLSSFYNISVEDAMQKVQSGISGELEPLRRLGYDLSTARLEQEALNLGIEKSVSDMTQAEKSQLRYYAMMTQVTAAQGDMARTLTAPANQMRVFRAEVTQCARALGNIFIPALNAVLPYVIAFVKVIRMAANFLAGLFGFELPEIDYSGISAGSAAVGDLADSADDATGSLGKASKAAEKLKNATLGIDELNIISPDEDTGSSGGSGGGSGGVGGGDLGIDLPTYDFLADAVSSKVDEIVQMIKDAMWEITAVVSGFLLAIGTILVVTGANIPLGLGLMAVGAVGLAAAIIANWDGMSERLARVLTLVTATLGGFLLAIGAFLTFTGANVPLGIGLMAAGAVSLATAATINWKFLNSDLKNALSILEGIVSGFLLAVGAVLAFTNVNLPLGIAFMAAGAVGLATAVALNWDILPSKIKQVLADIAAVVGGALLALGAILLLGGGTIPLAIGFLAAGAVALVSAVVLNWDSLTGSIGQVFKKITEIASAAVLGIGVILALSSPANIPLGVALIAAGAVGLAMTVGINWGAILTPIKTVLKEIGIAAGAALMAIGILLVSTMVAVPVGVALIAAGAAGLVAGVALNWGGITAKIKGVLEKIGSIGGSAAMIAIGLMLALTGVGIPAGIALIAKGAGSLVTGQPISWDKLVTDVKGGLEKISDAFSDWKNTVGEKLDDAKEKVNSWGEEADEKFHNVSEWVRSKITDPIYNALQNSEKPKFGVEIEDDSETWWSKVKSWWSNVSENGVDMEAGVELVKKGWTTVKNWIGNLPVVQQAIELAKKAWTTVKEWIGNIPTLDQAISLIKSGWTTVKNWIGALPVISQAISLIKSGWTTVKNWIGNIPTLSQAISLLKSGWSTVAGWVQQSLGGAVSAAITLAKSGWSTVAGWVSQQIGGAVSVTVNLLKGWAGTIKNWLGFENGGVMTNKGVQFAAGGGVFYGGTIPMYASGTNRPNHGSLFVAGENGAEMVGHIGGRTEVLNRFQLGSVMHSAVLDGMRQYTGYWSAIDKQLATCANAVIRAMNVNTDALYTGFGEANTYDPTQTLAQNVYDETQQAYEKAESYTNSSAGLRDFYHEYVEPTLQEIAADTKRQADKEEQTIVKIGNRTITDAVVTQQAANGFSFT